MNNEADRNGYQTNGDGGSVVMNDTVAGTINNPHSSSDQKQKNQ